MTNPLNLTHFALVQVLIADRDNAMQAGNMNDAAVLQGQIDAIVAEWGL